MTDGDADPADEVVDEAKAPAGDAADGSLDVSEYTTGERSISGRIRIIWGLRFLVSAIVLGAITTVVARATERLPAEFGPGLLLALLAVGIPWIHFRYRVWSYELRTDSLYLERGVFTHVKSIVPFVRIQHVDTQRGPFERALGLSTLVVYTAGSRGADVSIPGLTPAEARDLQSRVKQLAIETEGGDAV
ncbi:PH domain-containing protein [Halobacteriales archaeon Cl-PHB]